jgi:hypothetical protein
MDAGERLSLKLKYASIAMDSKPQEITKTNSSKKVLMLR